MYVVSILPHQFYTYVNLFCIMNELTVY